MALAAALLPHLETTGSDRLGIVVLEGRSFGNPIQLGLPLALIFLALVVDRGFVVWPRKPTRRASGSARRRDRAARSDDVARLLGRRLRGCGRRWALRKAQSSGCRRRRVRGCSRRAGGPLERDRRRRSTRGSSGRSRRTGACATEPVGVPTNGSSPGTQPPSRPVHSCTVTDRDSGRGCTPRSLARPPESSSKWGRKCPSTPGTCSCSLRPDSLAYSCSERGWSPQRLASSPGHAGQQLLYPAVCFLGYLLISATVSGTDTISGVFLGVGLLAAEERGHRRRRAAAGGDTTRRSGFVSEVR